MRRRLLSMMFLFVLVSGAVARLQLGVQGMPGVRIRSRSVADYLASQRILLSNFCRLDYEGARLQATGWNRFKPFTSLRANPGFERVVVVTRFDIESVEQPSAAVRVNYKAVGYYDFNDGYIPALANDMVIFRTQEQNDDLVIAEISPASPHVSPRTALEWVTARMNDTDTTEVERAHLKDAITELSKLVPKAKAAQ